MSYHVPTVHYTLCGILEWTVLKQCRGVGRVLPAGRAIPPNSLQVRDRGRPSYFVEVVCEGEDGLTWGGWVCRRCGRVLDVGFSWRLGEGRQAGPSKAHPLWHCCS